MFEPGDIVECVRNNGPYSSKELVRGAIYTVEWFCACGDNLPCGSPSDVDAVGVKEASGLDRGGWETGWDSSLFRLLKRRDPDMMHRLLHEPASMENA